MTNYQDVAEAAVLSSEEIAVFSTAFFTVPPLFNSRKSPEARGKAAIRAVALTATLAAATMLYAPKDADIAAPNLSPGSVVGRVMKPSPMDWLESLSVRHATEARKVVAASLKLDEPPDRLVPMANGGVAIYWLGKTLTPAGAAVRYALFECDRDRTEVVLSDHNPRNEQLFDVKHGHYEDAVRRAVTYVSFLQNVVDNVDALSYRASSLATSREQQRMKHLQLWIWLRQRGLSQGQLAAGLGKSNAFVSRRMNRDGFTVDEQAAVLAWARATSGDPRVDHADLFQQVAA